MYQIKEEFQDKFNAFKNIRLLKLQLIIISTIVIYSCSDNVENFSNGINYVHEGSEYKYVLKKLSKEIFLESNVVMVLEDEKIILFEQQIQKDKLIRKIAGDLDPYSKTFDESTLVLADSIVKASDKLMRQIKFQKAYWVLNKKTDSLYGPYKTKLDLGKQFKTNLINEL